MADVVLELCPIGVGAELVVTGDDPAFVELILTAAGRAVAGQPGPVVPLGGRASGRLWVAHAAAAQAFEAAQQAMRIGSTKRPILSR
jgi:DNA-binding IclR family transcriptional regulator